MSQNRLKPVAATQLIRGTKKPKTPAPSHDPHWSFSFRYYKQINYFGLDTAKANAQWFVSLLERLGDLSQKKLSEFFTDRALQGKAGYRFHAIDWNHKNIPIQREELNWLPNNYLNNEAEFPLFQFQISKAKGRVVGFFDESMTFNVVLLDPLHNIQPSKSFGYTVDKCSPLYCELTGLYQHLTNIQKSNCKDDNCGYQKALSEILGSYSLPTNAIIHYIDDDLASAAQSYIDNGHAKDFYDIFEAGIIYMSEHC
jgi:hypothetical protein